MPTSFLFPQLATKAKYENTPPWAAVCDYTKPQHLVVFFAYTYERQLAYSFFFTFS
jgi:hypothetical protein